MPNEPMDPNEAMAQAISDAVRRGTLSSGRDWSTPMVTHKRDIGLAALAPLSTQAWVADQFAVGYESGTGTSFYPFTADVSVLDGTLTSVDIVTG